MAVTYLVIKREWRSNAQNQGNALGYLYRILHFNDISDEKVHMGLKSLSISKISDYLRYVHIDIKYNKIAKIIIEKMILMLMTSTMKSQWEWKFRTCFSLSFQLTYNDHICLKQ